jgi:hypothetical protein
MANIYNLKINTSDIPAAVTSRSFTVTGDIGAKFILCIVQEGTLKYYDFRDNSFELGHNDKHNNLEVTMSRTVYNGNIIFPSGAATYVFKLIAVGDTETKLTNKHVITKSVTKLASDATITFSPATANTSNYATFPTSTSSGSPSDSKSFNVDWDITNASTDGGGFGLYYNLTDAAFDTKGQIIHDDYWYFQTTEAVADNPAGDGEDSDVVTVADVTDISVGTTLYYHKGTTVPTNKAGSAVGTTTVIGVDSDTKEIHFSQGVAFEDGETMTFRAFGAANIERAIGLQFETRHFNELFPTTVTKTIRAGSSGTTINLNGTYGIPGGNIAGVFGLGIDNSTQTTVVSVSASSSAGSIVVNNSQSGLTTGSTLQFGYPPISSNVGNPIKLTGEINITKYPTANRTINLDVDRFLSVGAAS